MRDLIPLFIFNSKYFYAMLITILWLICDKSLHCSFLSLQLLHIINVNDTITDILIDFFFTSDSSTSFPIDKNEYKWTNLFSILFHLSFFFFFNANVIANRRISFSSCLTYKRSQYEKYISI